MLQLVLLAKYAPQMLIGLIWYLCGALTYQWKSRSTACSSDWWFQTFFIFHNIWDNPPHWLYNIFFKMVKTTNQSCITIQCSTPRKPYPAGTTWGKFRARRDVIHGVGAKEVTDDSWSAPPRMLTGSFHCHLWRQEIGKMINGQPRMKILCWSIGGVTPEIVINW